MRTVKPRFKAVRTGPEKVNQTLFFYCVNFTLVRDRGVFQVVCV